MSVEFHYRVPWRSGGAWPGYHAGSAPGGGDAFLAHAPLAAGDARRIDVRATLADPWDRWLVRTFRQRASIPVYVVADLSASMTGMAGAKLAALAGFVEAVAWSALRTGDAFGFVGCDACVRADLLLPATRARATALAHAQRIAGLRPEGNAAGLARAAQHLGRRRALVFLVSDFHLDDALIARCLESLARHHVVPVVLWQAAESDPPQRFGLTTLVDAETGRRRDVLLRPRLAQRWRAAYASRRAGLDALFARHGLRPFRLAGDGLDADALTRYFLGEAGDA